ncbi:MAG: hypothetical protein CBD16_01155 [Betaproteobacteria bacterium TMED156]|nr:MAG: hypothetical protein CBD16_01155 [Betaproteobacteria bacterium TMED156]|tara:strand:- start:1182 stop:1973 length:792 start_codon:yes stop_codon:yes gene_type:complete
MTILLIISGTFLSGVGSVLIASLITWKIMARFTDYLLSFAAGTLLATAFLNLIPEAFEISSLDSSLMMWLLAGILFFFLLDKSKLYHHSHEHYHRQNQSIELKIKKLSPVSNSPKNNVWSIILLGDAIHCFADGILIASAFIADWTLGVLSTLAVLAHEIPHHVGDLVVVSNSLSSKQDALKKVSLAGFFAVFGGIMGFIFLESFDDLLPYFLILAASSFVYVSLADLIPQLQKELSLPETMYQLLWLFSGVFFIGFASHLGH